MPIYSFKNKDEENVLINGRTSVSSKEFDGDPLKYLRYLHDGRYRIYCDCMPQDAVSFPCLHDTYSTYYLRQSKSRPHHKDCPLVGMSCGDYTPPILGPTPPKIKPYQPGTNVAGGEDTNAGNGVVKGSRKNSTILLWKSLVGSAE